MITKNQLLEIIEYAIKNNISEAMAIKEMGYNFTNISFYKRKYGIKLKERKNISKNDIIRIINYRNTHRISYKQALNILGYRKIDISSYIKKFNITDNEIIKVYNPQRKYNVNDDFFEIPNLLNCYYAGFIAADGCVTTDNNRQIVSIILSLKDEEWINTYKNNLNIESPIRYDKDKENRNFVGIKFTSSKIINDLHDNFNIIPKKSLVLLPPKIDNELLKYAFICGYIDGDGSIVFNDKNGIQISLIGTKTMCEWIKSTFNALTNNCGCITKKERMFKLTYSCAASRSIFKKIYEMEIPKLSRKWTEDKYFYCINYIKGHNHTNKSINVFDINGNLIKKCASIKEASEFTKCSYSTVSHLGIKSSNHYQSNGFMFSREDKQMDAYIPHYTLKTKDISMYNEEYYKNFLKECNNIN